MFAAVEFNKIKIYTKNEETFTIHQTLIEDGTSINSIDFSKNGKHFAVASQDKFYLWYIDEDKTFQLVETLNVEFESICFTPDSLSLLCCGDNSIKFYDIEDNVMLDVIKGTDTIYMIKYIPETKTFIYNGYVESEDDIPHTYTKSATPRENGIYFNFEEYDGEIFGISMSNKISSRDSCTAVFRGYENKYVDIFEFAQDMNDHIQRIETENVVKLSEVSPDSSVIFISGVNDNGLLFAKVTIDHEEKYVEFQDFKNTNPDWNHVECVAFSPCSENLIVSSEVIENGVPFNFITVLKLNEGSIYRTVDEILIPGGPGINMLLFCPDRDEEDDEYGEEESESDSDSDSESESNSDDNNEESESDSESDEDISLNRPRE